MNALNKKYLFFITLAAIFLIWVEMNSPKPIDWQTSFSRFDKIPFGSYIVFDLLPEYFPDQNITANEEPLISAFYEHSLDEYSQNLILINQTFEFDEYELEELSLFVQNGGQVFIAAEEFGDHLKDSLSLQTGFEFVLPTDSLSLNFTHPALRSDSAYVYKQNTINFRFVSYDTSNTVVLARNNRNHPVFVRTRHGEGSFYFCSVPIAFTNYNMLYRDNHDFISKAISFLPRQDVVWDEYYKIGRKRISTPFRYILSRPALRRAFYLLLFCGAIFMIFGGKRQQRIIPIITPLANTTIEFVKTVGRLYYLNKDHKNILEKKIQHFLEHLRTRYYLRTEVISSELFQQISEKSGVAISEVQAIFTAIAKMRERNQISENDLLTVNNMIEQFYQESER